MCIRDRLALSPFIWSKMDPYKKNRILGLFDPDKYSTIMWQQNMGKISIGSGKILGKGFFTDNPVSYTHLNNIAGGGKRPCQIEILFCGTFYKGQGRRQTYIYHRHEKSLSLIHIWYCFLNPPVCISVDKTAAAFWFKARCV